MSLHKFKVGDYVRRNPDAKLYNCFWDRQVESYGFDFNTTFRIVAVNGTSMRAMHPLWGNETKGFEAPNWLPAIRLEDRNLEDYL